MLLTPMSTTAISEFVLAECSRNENAFGLSFFDEHVALVVSYGKKLAQQLGADVEIVELAAYLHDLSAVRDVTILSEHAIRGAVLAQRLLSEWGYSVDKARRVAECIASHSSPIPLGVGTLEEVCLSNADAIAQISRPTFWLFYAFTIRKLSFTAGRQWLLNLVERNWTTMVGPARDMAREAYQLAAKLLQS